MGSLPTAEYQACPLDSICAQHGRGAGTCEIDLIIVAHGEPDVAKCRADLEEEVERGARGTNRLLEKRRQEVRPRGGGVEGGGGGRKRGDSSIAKSNAGGAQRGDTCNNVYTKRDCLVAEWS